METLISFTSAASLGMIGYYWSQDNLDAVLILLIGWTITKMSKEKKGFILFSAFSLAGIVLNLVAPMIGLGYMPESIVQIYDDRYFVYHFNIGTVTILTGLCLMILANILVNLQKERINNEDSI